MNEEPLDLLLMERYGELITPSLLSDPSFYPESTSHKLRNHQSIVNHEVYLNDTENNINRLPYESLEEISTSILQLKKNTKNEIYKINEITKLPYRHKDHEDKINPYASLSPSSIANSINPRIYIPATQTSPTIPNVGSGFGSLSVPAQINYPYLGSTKPEELPEMAMPVLEFIDQVQPHIVIGCDRGGRLFSLAIHAAWRETRDGQPFPTLDGKIHFARISKSENPAVLQEKVDAIIELSKRLAEHKGNIVDDDEQLRVLFVDDWVIGGGTKRLAEMLVEKHGAKSFFAVMSGGKADATGEPDLRTNVSWHDRPEHIGVNYLSTLRELTDGSFAQYQEVVPVRDPQAIANRVLIQQAAITLGKVAKPATVVNYSLN